MPCSVRWRSHDAGSCPAGTNSRGYWYFSCSRSNRQRSAIFRFPPAGLAGRSLQGLQGTQVAFPVGEEIGAGLADRKMVADRCHAVLQGCLPRACMGRRRRPRAVAGDARRARAVCPGGHRHRRRDATRRPAKGAGEAFAEPGSLLVPMVVRQPDRQQAGERLLQIFAQQPVVALVGLSPAAGDEATEVLVAPPGPPPGGPAWAPVRGGFRCR